MKKDIKKTALLLICFLFFVLFSCSGGFSSDSSNSSEFKEPIFGKDSLQER